MLKVVYKDIHEIIKKEELRQTILSLPIARKTEILKKSNPKAQLQSTAVTLLLEGLLFECGITKYEMIKNQDGKPYFLIPEELHVSLSHSLNMVACALSDHSVGIDIQFMKKIPFSRFSNRFFSKKEREQIDEVIESEKRKVFYRIWTAKESFQKMIGQGIFTAFGSIIVHADEQIIENLSGDKVGKLSFYEKNEYCICVCTKN